MSNNLERFADNWLFAYQLKVKQSTVIIPLLNRNTVAVLDQETDEKQIIAIKIRKH